MGEVETLADWYGDIPFGHETVRLVAWNLVPEHSQEAVLQHESSMKVKDVRKFWPRRRKP